MNFEFDEALSKVWGTGKGLVVEGLSLSDNQSIAKSKAIDTYGKATEHNGKADAMRHIIFSALATQDYTDVGAKTMSWLHENVSLGSFNQPDVEQAMDTTNDTIGREIGKKAKSKEEIFQMAREAIDSGKAKVIGNTTEGPYY